MAVKVHKFDKAKYPTGIVREISNLLELQGHANIIDLIGAFFDVNVYQVMELGIGEFLFLMF